MTINRFDLFDIMWDLGVPAPHGEVSDRDRMIDDLADNYEDIDTWDLDRLTYYYQRYQSNNRREDLCNLIADYVRFDDIKESIDEY